MNAPIGNFPRESKFHCNPAELNTRGGIAAQAAGYAFEA